jgi:hypothetical protein
LEWRLRKHVVRVAAETDESPSLGISVKAMIAMIFAIP